MKGITCLCPTYGRPALLCEAIECFLRQTFSGPSELLILNDCSDQTLRYSGPVLPNKDVVVINLSRKFRTLGEKYHAVAALARYDYLAPWEDDDIYLSHRLRLSSSRLERTPHYFKSSRAFFVNNGHIDGIPSNVHFSSGIWSRQFYAMVGGFSIENRALDATLEKRFAEAKDQLPGGYGLDPDLPDHLVYYLYRWAGTQAPHVSAMPGQDDVAAAEDYLKILRSNPKWQTGEVSLHPVWAQDYEKLVLDYLERQHDAPSCDK